MALSNNDVKFFQSAERRFVSKVKEELHTIRLEPDPNQRDWTPVRDAFLMHGHFLMLHPQATETPLVEKRRTPQTPPKERQ